MSPALLLGGLIASFLIGSIPFGVLIGRAFFKSDIRASGSGNIGAANALRSYGKAGGLAVLVLDGLKGAAAALLGNALASGAVTGTSLAALFGAAAVCGHCYSPWLGFRGGKGVATLLGALFALAPLAGLGFVVVWLALVLPTRFASLGSLVASALAPVGILLETGDAAAARAFAAAVLVIVWKHRENIARLARGRENKLTFGRAGAKS